MKEMETKKINVLVVIGILIITSINIVVNNNSIVASSEPEESTFDYELIYNVAQFLSWRINQSYDIQNGELAKGRYFGSKGEQDSAYYLATKLEELDIYPPNPDGNPQNKYF